MVQGGYWKPQPDNPAYFPNLPNTTAREKAVQAQEAAMGALNLPSAADIERLVLRHASDIDFARVSRHVRQLAELMELPERADEFERFINGIERKI